MVLETPMRRGRVREAGRIVTPTEYLFLPRKSLEQKGRKHAKDAKLNIFKREMAAKDLQTATLRQCSRAKGVLTYD